MSKLYTDADNGKHAANLDGVIDTLDNAVNHGVYDQAFSNIDTINDMSSYTNIAMYDYDLLEMLTEKVDDGKIKQPVGSSGWYTLLSKYAKR
jgi:hypothetical protein